MKVRAVEGIDCLKEAIRTVPIPGAPPRLSHQGAAVGLAFLDIALRQNHVRRLTQRLSLIEHRAARCTTEVDISLGLLDDGQRIAGRYYHHFRNREAMQPEQIEDPDLVMRPGELIWVPVSRISRRSQAPIDVTGSSGAKVPRLTQYETSWLLASGMYRLLRTILATQPRATKFDQTELSDFLHRKHETRWLVQAALVALLTERRKPAIAWPNHLQGAGARQRDEAIRLLDSQDLVLGDYKRLLDLAVNQYLLVVGLDPSRDEHLLAFDSPLHLEKDRRLSRLWRPLRLAGGSYFVQYKTQLPSALRAYHLVAETEHTMRINTIYMQSDADSGIVDELKADLTTLAPKVNRKTLPSSGPDRQLIELEVQACLRRLADLVRRRRWEASQARLDLSGKALRASQVLARVSLAGETATTGGQESVLNQGDITPERMTRAAAEIEAHDLKQDLSVERDPAGDRAHVYWRRDPSRAELKDTIDITASVFVRDTSGSRFNSVVAYVAGVVLTSYVLGWLMFDTPWPYLTRGPVQESSNADAIIAVLLLLPGFLYARLHLPARQTILGRLRVLPRFVANVTIAALAFLAATISAGADPLIIRLALTICAAVPAVAALAMVAVSSMVPSDPLSAAADLPGWAATGSALRKNGRSTSATWSRKRPRRRMLFRVPDAIFKTLDAKQDGAA
jgi:hypothetical protein